MPWIRSVTSTRDNLGSSYSTVKHPCLRTEADRQLQLGADCVFSSFCVGRSRTSQPLVEGLLTDRRVAEGQQPA